MRTQLPLEVVDLSAVIARIFGCWQQLQPDGVAFQSSQPEHPLQRHRKIPAAFQIFSGKPATEENCHLGKIARTVQFFRAVSVPSLALCSHSSAFLRSTSTPIPFW